MTKRRTVLLGISLLLALTGVVRYGNSLLILHESDAPSRSFGTRDARRLENGKRLPGLQPLLFRAPQGQLLRARMRFSTRPAWVRHDEHYHVDFRLL